ncbi:hypothetical protein ATANTOWER_029040, partial [Ataeniobius toweri]|nr:hypothetical protein [Ataeniobius toweri]
MNKDSNLLDLTGWQPPVFFAPCIPFKNPVHPPPSTVPTSENPGPSYHPGTPLSTIICLTGKQLFGLSAPHPLVAHSINPVAIKHIPKKKVVLKHKDENGRQLALEVAIMLKLRAVTTSSVEQSSTVVLLDWYDLDQELILVMERPMSAESLFDHLKDHKGPLKQKE